LSSRKAPTLLNETKMGKYKLQEYEGKHNNMKEQIFEQQKAKK
jgi:hypothetical protein